MNGEQVGWAVPTEVQDGGQSPSYAAEQAELHAVLRVLIECLPASQREAIDLWADGFSYVDISQIIGKQEGHVRVLVHRGLKALREHPQVRALMEDSDDEVKDDLAVIAAVAREVADGSHRWNTDKTQIEMEWWERIFKHEVTKDTKER